MKAHRTTIYKMMNIKVLLVHSKLEQMSRYLDVVYELFDQRLTKIEENYEKAILKETEGSEYNDYLTDQYTDDFLDTGRNFPDLLLSSFITAWYSFIEQELTSICNTFNLDTETIEKIKKDKGIKRARKILREMAMYEIDPVHWQELVEIARLRNFIVHNGLRVSGVFSTSKTKGVEITAINNIKYYFPIKPMLFKYLRKHKLIEQHIGYIEIMPTFSFCRYLIQLSRALLIKLHGDLSRSSALSS